MFLCTHLLTMLRHASGNAIAERRPGKTHASTAGKTGKTSAGSQAETTWIMSHKHGRGNVFRGLILGIIIHNKNVMYNYIFVSISVFQVFIEI